MTHPAAAPSSIDWRTSKAGPIAFEVRIRSPGPCEGLISAGMMEDSAFPMVWRVGTDLPGAAATMVPKATAYGHGVEFPATPSKFGFALRGEHPWDNLTVLVAFQHAHNTDELEGDAFSAVVKCPEGASIQTRASRQILAGSLDALGCTVGANVAFVEYACLDAEWEGNMTGDVQWAAHFGSGLQEMAIQTPTTTYRWDNTGGPAPEELVWDPGVYKVTVAYSATLPTPVSLRILLLTGLHDVDSADDLDSLPT